MARNAASRTTGAGVLLVETYRGRPAVLLFRDRRTGKYTDPGGGRDAGEDALACAAREATEESLGLFRISRADLAALARDTPHRVLELDRPPHRYTSVVVPVSGVRRTAFRTNLALTRAHAAQLPDMWNESDDMTRFYVADLLRAVTMQGDSVHGAASTCRDVYGATCTLAKRTTQVLREAHARGVLRSSPLDTRSHTRHTLRLDTRTRQGQGQGQGLGYRGSTVERATSGRTRAFTSGRHL
jgi:8-oxo-dGTP pyrophosphatase MutT (NUDIX family)